MSVSRSTIDRLIAFSAQPHRNGDWREFCQREGVCYQTLRYWREKLELRRRKKKTVNPKMHPASASV